MILCMKDCCAHMRLKVEFSMIILFYVLIVSCVSFGY